MITTFCPECEHSLNLGAQPYVGQRVICPQCGARLEVVSLRPLELDWVYE
jgi:lysine biosynthesis protein LysW